MAVSGSVNLTQTRDDIITEALEHIGVLAEGESPNANQLTSVGRTLNLMVKAWQGRGVNIFAVDDLYVFMDGTSTSFQLLNGSSDHFTKTYVRTELEADASASDTSISVDDASSISNGDNIGIELDDGTMQWTTVNGAPAGNTVTLLAGLSGATSIDKAVFAYTTQAERPMKVLEAYRNTSEGVDIPIWTETDRKYHLLSDKDSAGTVNTVYYDPQVSDPRLYVWPITGNVSDILHLRIMRTLNDLDSASDDLDFPQEWYEALALNLAVKLCPKYGVSSEVFNQLGKLATTSLFDAESNDTEAEIRFFPDEYGGHG